MKFLDISGFTYFYNRLKEKLNAKADSSSVNESISSIQSSISAEISRSTTSENALSARMDEFSKLPSGSTAGDAELIDIRVKADGTTASSAGTAVREQVIDLNNRIRAVSDIENIPCTLIADKYVSSTGEILISDTWNLTQIIEIDRNYSYFYSGLNNIGRNPKICFYSSTSMTTANCVGYADPVTGLSLLSFPANAKYFAISVKDDDINTFALNRCIKYNGAISKNSSRITALESMNDKVYTIEDIYYTLTPDKYYGQDGNVYISDVWNITNLIPLDGVIYYDGVTTTGNAPGWCFYKSDVAIAENLVSYIKPSTGENVLNVPNGAKYVGLSIHDNDANAFKIHRIVTNFNDEETYALQNAVEDVYAKNPNLNVPFYKASECSLDNLAWSWWMYPQVVVDNVRRNRAYFGCVTQSGMASVGSIDLENKSVKQTWLWNAGADDHNGMAVFYHESKSRIFAFSTMHNNENYIHEYYSAHTYGADYFENEVLIPFADRVTYAQVFYDATHDRLAVFTRYAVNSWYVKFSTNSFGNQWDPAGVNEYPVVTTPNIQYYCIFRKTNINGVLRIVMYSNPNWTPNDTNIRMGFLHLSDGSIYDADNVTALGSIYSGGVAYNRFSIVVPVETGKRNRLLDVVDGAAPERVFIAYASFTDDSDAVYNVYYNGQVKNVVEAGTPFYTPSIYVGGLVFNTKNKDIVYLSRMDGTTDKIERYSYINGEYVLDGVIATATHSANNNRVIRPIIDKDSKILIYQRGLVNLTNFSDYKLDADYLVLT